MSDYLVIVMILCLKTKNISWRFIYKTFSTIFYTQKISWITWTTCYKNVSYLFDNFYATKIGNDDHIVFLGYHIKMGGIKQWTVIVL